MTYLFGVIKPITQVRALSIDLGIFFIIYFLTDLPKLVVYFSP